MRPRSLFVALVLTMALALLGWMLAFDINDPTIPLVREIFFVEGSLFGMAAFLAVLVDSGKEGGR